ncbi:MAG: ATP-binding protein [Deferribacterales bacterium]
MIKYVNAVYKPQVPTQYRGNPLIEALPEIRNEDDLGLALMRLPYYTRDEINQPPEIKQYSINKLFAYFQPFDTHIDYAYQIDIMIREGYVGRNPLDVINPALKSVKPLDTGHDYESARTRAFTGVSGIGKTTSTKRVLSLYDQVILHEPTEENEGLNIWQVTWLKVECPIDASLKQLCTNFFTEMDKILGTNYCEKYIKSRNSVEDMITMMAKVASIHYLGILVIDEIQNISKLKAGGYEKILNFFVSLSNTISIPVLLIGTLKANEMLQKDLRIGRRMDGPGGIEWHRFENDPLWELFVEGFWEYTWLRNHPGLTKEFIDVFYEESQGIIDAAMKIYALVQRHSVKQGSETFTVETVRDIAQKGLIFMRPMLNALKSGDPIEIARYGDITPVSFEEISKKLFSTPEYFKRTVQNAENTVEKQKEKIASAINLLLAEHIDYDLAEQYVCDILKKNPSATAPDIALKALNKIKKIPNSSSEDKGSKYPIVLDCYDSAQDTGASVYSIVNSSGWIKNPLGDFTLA